MSVKSESSSESSDINNDNFEICVICQDEINVKSYISLKRCNHVYHKKCFMQYKKKRNTNKCLVCNQPIQRIDTIIDQCIDYDLMNKNDFIFLYGYFQDQPNSANLKYNNMHGGILFTAYDYSIQEEIYNSYKSRTQKKYQINTGIDDYIIDFKNELNISNSNDKFYLQYQKGNKYKSRPVVCGKFGELCKKYFIVGIDDDMFFDKYYYIYTYGKAYLLSMDIQSSLINNRNLRTLDFTFGDDDINLNIYHDSDRYESKRDSNSKNNNDDYVLMNCDYNKFKTLRFSELLF